MPEAGESSDTEQIDSLLVHAILALKKVEFSGNHVIDRDTQGEFDPPHWELGRARQWPVCYTRTKNVKLKATFEVIAPPDATESVKLKGVAVLGAATLEWTTSVSVSPGDTEVVTGELTSSAPLPNEVNCYDPATIEWEEEPPGAPAFLAGASENVMYVTLGDPKDTAYWTLLDISCRAAAGATSAAQLISQAYAPFRSRELSRMRDNEGLKYWIPDNTSAQSTYDLLSGDGGGQCGSWAEFLIDMYGVHGESARKVMIMVTMADLRMGLSDDPAVAVKARGFLVKQWIFMGPGSLPSPFTHQMRIECVPFPIPGQRNDDPPPAFVNHYIVWALGLFYDPSYGSPPVATPLEWENASIDGLYKGWGAGFPKEDHLTRQLLQFV